MRTAKVGYYRFVEKLDEVLEKDEDVWQNFVEALETANLNLYVLVGE